MAFPHNDFFINRNKIWRPVIPIHFIICAELLARQLYYEEPKRAQALGVCLGHARIRIPFLTFADDTIIFAKANHQACQIIKDILDKYCTMPGQLVNYHKSTFQCTNNVLAQLITKFQSILEMEHVSTLDSYFVCPFIDKRVNSTTFIKIIANTNS